MMQPVNALHSLSRPPWGQLADKDPAVLAARGLMIPFAIAYTRGFGCLSVCECVALQQM